MWFLSWEQTQLWLVSKPWASAPLWVWDLSLVVTAMLLCCVRDKHICWLLCHWQKPRTQLSHWRVHDIPVAANPPSGIRMPSWASSSGSWCTSCGSVQGEGSGSFSSGFSVGDALRRLWAESDGGHGSLRGSGESFAHLLTLWLMRDTYPMPSGHLLSREHKCTIKKLFSITFPPAYWEKKMLQGNTLAEETIWALSRVIKSLYSNCMLANIDWFCWIFHQN